ncbi:6-bladed beta-propeller [Puteibacter caeruleilacunae]|nr:6-bladed beta-propeller [Puteibacter caeruleilacunae]
MTTMKRLNLSYRLTALLVFIFIISFSCKEKSSTETGAFFTIPFSEIIKDQREVRLSEFAKDVQIVPLENSTKALLGKFESIAVTKDYIFVMCWNRPILQFSHDGKLIREIGGIGKGPEEYIFCLNMSIDEKHERVYIQTPQMSVKVFDFKGEYVEAIKITGMRPYFWGRDSLLVSYCEPVSGSEQFVFTEYNGPSDTVQGVPNYIVYDSDERADPFHMSPFDEQNFSYRFAGRLHLKGCYNDTVYWYDANNKIVPKFFIDLKEYKLPGDLIYERKWHRTLSHDLCWTGVHETSDYIFIPYGYHYNLNKPESKKEEKGYVLFNKKTNDGVAVQESLTGGFVDDINGGPDFRPNVINDNSAVMLVSALEMKQYLDSEPFKSREVKSPEEKEKLNQLKETLKEDDNHVLVIVKF